MFKKFKDKLAEEMKQSPARLQASMQQLAQAVVSPSLSNNSIQDLPFKDNFSLTEETDETPKNSPTKHGFQTIDLTPPSINSSTSRRSSVSSNVSDASFLFPIYESSGNLYNLQQSDMDQSASEMDDNISPQLDHISKEQLYSAYRKARAKYDKYRGRFTDLLSHYRDIEHSKTKLESLLVETQDKALRRISDLKEQCQLEQQAKAHLEDALRNDIEEKDHVINSLKIKIKLLQEKGPNNESIENIQSSNNQDNDKVDILVDLSSNTDSEKLSEESKLFTENAQLKEKIQKMETFLEKYKDMLKRNKDKILEVANEKNTLERDYDILQKSNQDKLDDMEKELRKSREEFANLRDEIEVLKRREEESVISLAENKLSIHRELEGKEEQIKQLQLELKQTYDLEKSLKETVEQQKQELEKVKLVANQNAEASQEHLRGKSEALKQMQSEMQEKLIHLEEKMSLKHLEEVNKNKQLLIKLQEFEKQPKATEDDTKAIKKLTQILEEKESLLIELDREKEEYKRLLDSHKSEIIHLKQELNKVTSSLENVQCDANNRDSILKTNYDKEFNALKDDLEDKIKECDEANLTIQKLTEELEGFKCKLQTKDEEIGILKGKAHDDAEIMHKLQDEFENKNREILEFANKLKSSTITINDHEEEINNLVNHKDNLIKYIGICKNDCKRLKDDYESLKNNIINSIFNGKDAIFETVRETGKILSFLNEKEASLKLQINELSEKNERINELKSNSNDNTVQLKQILSDKASLENELTSKFNEVEEMKIKMNSFNELKATNITLKLENECLCSKLHEINESFNEREQLYERAILEKEKILENISLEKQQREKMYREFNLKVSENEGLSTQLTDLSTRYQELQGIVHTLKFEKEDHNKLIKEIQIIKLELEDKSNQLKALQTKSEEEKQRLRQTDSECENYKITIEANNQKLLNLSKELSISKEVRKKLSIELEKSRDSLQQLKDNNSIVETELEQEKLKFKTVESERNRAINSKTTEIQELQQHCSELMSELNNLKANNNILEELKADRESVIHEFDELKSSHLLLQNENKSLKDNHKALLTLNSKITDENNTFLRELEFCKKQLQNSNNDMDNFKARVNELDVLKNKNIELTSLLEEANDYQKKCASLIDEVGKLTRANESLTSELESLQNQMLNLKQCRVKSENLEHELAARKNEITKLESSMSLKNEELINVCSNAEEESHNFKIELEEKNAQIKEREFKNLQLLEKIDELSLLKLNIEDKTRKEIDGWRESSDKLENVLATKESELKALHEQYVKLEERMKSIEEKLTEDLSRNIENASMEKRKLESQLDETLVTFQVKETQMQALNDELKNQACKLRDQLKINEDEQNLRLKQIVKEFQAQLNDKEKELQAALEKRFDRQQNFESNTIQEYKEQLKDFQVQVTKKSEQIEKLIFDNEQIQKQIQDEVEKRLAIMSQAKLEHVDNKIQGLDKKWEDIVKEKTNQLEMKHEQEIAELSNEWQNERKSDENTELLDKELENTTRVAMAAVQSNTGSFHTLQQTLLSQKRELAELRKLVKMRQESVEDSTEIEYLKNILYKYMMGKETMVLAKVIAAVVKFDQDQTSKILKKEEDKLSLLGSLGLT
ncbi:PREDICTED: golgin subfamily A member 4 [Ceratosolen solmsi marchali]|uniref:Golgin subfamily A member 4 n=1 Tax=Ceratosolen solmsi marchali TaxID=326594 RepID=A0AAJ6YBP9_9HYME|nr:PREDICTED: golgin subfamily A member 4 [Ceratosolen solmsi marchali]